MLHWVSKILHMRLLGNSVCLWELVLVHSLHSHLFLHERHLSLLRVQELLLLVLCLILASVVNPFQLRAAVSLVRLLRISLANEPALVQVTHFVWRSLKLVPLERHCNFEGLGQIVFWTDKR